MPGVKGQGERHRDRYLPPPTNRIGDPPHEEGALRCFVCAAPERPGVLKVYSGMWAHLRFHVDMAICAKCLAYAANRTDADLTTLEAA